jgi:adenylate cyclase
MVKKVFKSGQQDIALNSELILLKKGDVVEHERRRKFATINLTVIPLHGPNKEVLGCMLVIEDITTEKSLRRTMARYLPKEITDKLLAEDSSSLGGKMQKASVLFSDIRAFTHIAEQIGPQKTVSMLNDYFSTMVEIISEHGGILDKYIGDAMMAVFGVPYLQHDDADRALISGIHMLRELAHFNQDWQEKGNDPIRIGIGLNTDLVLSGNIGAPQRMDFTVIGDGVNVASRLETANKFYGTRMLISEYTIKALTETYRFREIDKVLVKGRVEPLTIFEPLATYVEADNEKITALEPIYQEALGLYKQRQFQRATEAFKDVLAIKDDDPVTHLYLQRCKELVATPPDEKWSGVWSLTEK